RRAITLDNGITPEQEARKLILTDKFTYIPETKVYTYIVTKVYTDYSFSEDYRDPGLIIKPRLGVR
ncbi:hypothetical protein OFB78_28495, partial [Escherichia coli]|nr:hypothetical protein [Escherichia coli]